MDSTRVQKVGILLFNDVDTMDFVGPYEVFNDVNLTSSHKQYDLFTISEKKGDINSCGLVVKAEYDFTDCPQIDILVIPGGNVTSELLSNDNIGNWIKVQSKKVEIIFSVCNGAGLIAKAGLLKGLSATTHHSFFEKLAEIDPTIHILKNERFVDNGHIITAGGIAAGIDAALAIVFKVSGGEAFRKASEIMEYGKVWDQFQKKQAGQDIARKINNNCIKCGKCAKVCPFNAVSEGENKYEINFEKCLGIGPCAEMCPVGAIESPI